MTIDFTTFDADNHYYEATDAFTRHLDPKMAGGPCSGPRSTADSACWSPARSTASSPTRTFDPVAKPGSLDEYFRGRNPESKDIASLFGDLEPIRPEYRDRDARSGGHGRTGHRRVLPLPHPRGRDGGGVGRRSRSGGGGLPRLQPVARRGLGLPLPGPHLRRPDDPAGRYRRRGGRARRGAGAPMPASCASRAVRPTPRPDLRLPATADSTRSGPVSTRPA